MDLVLVVYRREEQLEWALSPHVKCYNCTIISVEVTVIRIINVTTPAWIDLGCDNISAAVLYNYILYCPHHTGRIVHDLVTTVFGAKKKALW